MRNRNLVIVLGVVIVVLAATNLLTGLALMSNDISLKEIFSREEKSIKDKAAEHILFPGESPTVAEIQDVQTLKQSNPVFYENARDGHYLLVFSDRAIIYDEKNDVIVNVAPIVEDIQNENNNSDGQQPADQPLVTEDSPL